MKITAQLVNELRQRTGIGMMECKKSLQESEGDIEKAITILRKKGFARAKDKMSRKTADGVVGSYIHLNGKLGVLVEINCESDFVARNEDIPEDIVNQEKEIIHEQFKDSNKPPQVIDKIVQGKLGKFYSEVCLLNQPYIKEDKMTIDQYIASFVAKFGENIRVKRFARFALDES